MDMCGILGWCNFQDKRDIQNLRRASKFIKSGGPDAIGEFIGNEISFIHTRLFIIDINNRSDQPLKMISLVTLFLIMAKFIIINYCERFRE